MRLQDRVVVITGAGAGMGRARAHRFAKEGAKLVVDEIDLGRLDAVVAEVEAAGMGGASAVVVYTASKHAVVGLTRNTAYTYAPNATRCNAIIAGAVNTSIGTSLDQSQMDQEALARYSKYHAITPGQLEPEDIANLAMFLASDESKLINGALVAADAGWTSA